MNDVRLTRELLAAGYTHNELAKLVRTKQFTHVRRGAYSNRSGENLDGAARHLRLVAATVQLAATDAVVSHLSAAVVHGLPVMTRDLGPVHLTRSSIRGGKRRSGVHAHAAALREEDVVTVNGISTTSLARTVVDVGRSQPFRFAVMAGDAALRLGLPSHALTDSIRHAAGWPQVAAARRVAAFVDPLSESPGESLSRVCLHEAGIPTPALQYEVCDGARPVGRADFCWEENRTLGEFDGRTKYGRLLKPDERTEDVVYREKLREDALRDLGWQVVRWVWADLDTPGVIVDRLLRAFRRAAP